MKVHLKAPGEIAVMADAGKRLRAVVEELIPAIVAGITTKEIDEKADLFIKKHGGESSFKKVARYSWSTCLPINEQIVHTPPSSRQLKKGDVLTVDIGLYRAGYHTDFATTFVVGGGADLETNRFLKRGKETLDKAIEVARHGRFIGDISALIEREITQAGYSITKELTGHGIGRSLHEDPMVPGYLDRPVGKTYPLQPGLVIAIEVIYAQGEGKIAYEKGSEWSIVTSDRSLAACFEHTVAITAEKTLIIT